MLADSFFLSFGVLCSCFFFFQSSKTLFSSKNEKTRHLWCSHDRRSLVHFKAPKLSGRIHDLDRIVFDCSSFVVLVTVNILWQREIFGNFFAFHCDKERHASLVTFILLHINVLLSDLVDRGCTSRVFFFTKKKRVQWIYEENTHVDPKIEGCVSYFISKRLGEWVYTHEHTHSSTYYMYTRVQVYPVLHLFKTSLLKIHVIPRCMSSCKMYKIIVEHLFIYLNTR